MRPILLHLGYYKTATTSLQEQVFLPEHGVHRPWSVNELIERFALAEPFEWDADGMRRDLERAHAEAEQRGHVLAFSCERFSGSPFDGGTDARLQIDRCKDLVPDARVLVTIRRQPDMILTCYKHYVRAGGAQSLSRFIDQPRLGRDTVPFFRARFFEYHRLIEYVQKLWGRDRVLVLPFELLKKNPASYLKAIGDHMGATLPSAMPPDPLNVSLCGLTLGLKRRANFWFSPHIMNPAAPFGGRLTNRVLQRTFLAIDRVLPRPLRAWSDRRYRRILDRRLSGVFEASNRRVAELTGIDLGAYGYVMPRV